MTVVTGTTTDGATFSYSAPSSDADQVDQLNTIRNNMHVLGWNVNAYQVDVKIGHFGRKTVMGAQEIGRDGSLTGNYIDFTSDAIKGMLQRGAVNISGSNLFRSVNKINSAIQFGKSMYNFIRAMKNVEDGSAQLQYLLTQPEGADMISSAANMLEVSPRFTPGTLAFAKDGAFNLTFDSRVYRATILVPATRILLSGLSFCYF
jgi:hypothetical protein